VNPCKQFLNEVSEFQTRENVYSFVDGVEIGLRISRAGDCIYILKIHSSIRGEGLASGTLREVCSIADNLGVTLFLEVEESDGLTKKELGDWYWRFGFRGDYSMMERGPK